MSRDCEPPSDCEEIVATVATAINSLKSQTISLSNKNRKKWRGRDASSGYSLRATPTSGGVQPRELAQTDNVLSRVAVPENGDTSVREMSQSQPPQPPAPTSTTASTESVQSSTDSTVAGSSDAVQLLTDPTTLEVLRKLLSLSEELATAQSAQ